MKVKDELCQKLKDKMDAYGLDLEETDCQNAFWAVINSTPGSATYGEPLLTQKAREIWNEWVSKIESETPDAGTPAQPEAVAEA